MHNAPAMSFHVLRSAFPAKVLALALLAGLLAGALWIHQSQHASWRQGLFAGTLLLALVWGLNLWRTGPSGLLSWDGMAWQWTDEKGGQAVGVRIRLDFQHLLLLELRATSASAFWLWPCRASSDAAWLALRRALVAHERRSPVVHSPSVGGDPAGEVAEVSGRAS